MPVKWIVGIDEVGRGALAGPLVVAAVVFPSNYGGPTSVVGDIWGGRDSKQLTSRQRMVVRDVLVAHPRVAWAVAAASARHIDRDGMTVAGRRAVRSAFAKLPMSVTDRALVLLDGGLSAPESVRHLTIVKGDAQFPVIAAASIVAKVHRDRLMYHHHRRFPQYGFDAHVGYGTKAHYAALRRHGPSPLHRRSFRLL